MFIHLLIAVFAGFMGYNMGKGSKDPLRVGPKAKVGEDFDGRGDCPTRYRDLLTSVVRRNLKPSRALLECAFAEAQNVGDRVSMNAILDLVCPPAIGPASEKHTDVIPQGPGEGIVSHASHSPSPIPDVTDEEWGSFCESLRTRAVNFSNDRHVGSYEHSRARLKKLGIEDAALVDDVTQQEALAADMADYHESASKLIGDYTGDVVRVPTEAGSEDIPVTLSGVLGLLKAAGPRGAESWLSNESDRSKYPKTTEIFLRTNGCF